MGAGRAVNKRFLLIAGIFAISAAVAIALGVGLGLSRKSTSGNDGTSGCMHQEPEPTRSPLFPAPSSSKQGHYRFAAVAADTEECSQIGTRIMARDGGSAVDAAIAAIVCVGVHHAHSSGLGGGHFMTYYNRKDRKAYAIIAREQAPSGASEDMFTSDKNTSSRVGGLAIGIPGEIKGLKLAHDLGGKLPWKQLFLPTIRLCQDGFRVGKSLAGAIEKSRSFSETFPDFRETFTNPDTHDLYREGEIMRRPKLAQTLQIIADEGADAFYNGSLSRNISLDVQDADGIITEDDLRNYTTRQKDVLNFTLHDGYTVLSPPPPSSGAIYQFIINILNGYKLSNVSVSTLDDAILTWHRTIEAFKHAYALRTDLGDYDVETEDVRSKIRELVANLTSPDFGEHRRSRIDDDRTFNTAYYEPTFYSTNDHGTSHLSVLGPNGDAVSITSTINLYFGSKIVGKRTGIIFNNEMDDFSTPGLINAFGVPPSPANFIKPWKRPLSSMCPSVVVDPDGDVRLVVGASGGTRITTASALVTMETLWYGWGIKTAVDYPRVHHQLVPETTSIQIGFPRAIIDGLLAKGHNITMKKSASSVCQAIKQTRREVITANSDYRKYGVPDGY